MKIRHVQFPCGRRGLEVETECFSGWTGVQGYTYDYYFNDQDYVDFAHNEGMVLKKTYWGQIEGLVVLKECVPVEQLISKASSDWM